MTCIDCGKEIPSFVLRCRACNRRHNLEKAQNCIRYEFRPIETDPDKLFTNMTTEHIPEDLLR